ncbi:MAG: hypothetical protein Q9196_001480 [Gyalolechia fulgens]
MSRSHSYSSHHSRGNRSYRAPNLAVTEASFQGLQLSDTTLQPTYTTANNQYPPRGTYGPESLRPTYLAPGYDTASFTSSSPSGSYLGSQRGVSPFAALETEACDFFEPEASAYQKPDMGLQGSRRLAKARMRRRRPPTIVEPEASMRGLHVSRAIDFFAAPSTSSSYDIGGSGGYPRTATTSSSPYLGGIAGYRGPADVDVFLRLTLLARSSHAYGPSYSPSYSVGDITAPTLYPA